MSIPLYQVDAFADEPFQGNPACVCLMDRQKPDSWLQSVASEMNLSETAFVWPTDELFHLRWFTPVAEVELCGHATLAASHVLWLAGRLDAKQAAVFQSLSGKLTARKIGDRIEMDFPSNRPVEVSAPDGMLESLGIVNPVFVGFGASDVVVQVESESIVKQLQPDFRALRNVDVRGVAVTAVSESREFDFVSRFFAPRFGIDEDPVTGSAHTMLAPYWSEILGKTELRAFQASTRGGCISVRVDGKRVFLGGHAKTIFSGALLV